MLIEQSDFGVTRSGGHAHLFSIQNGSGMRAVLTDYGAILVSLFVPGPDGITRDVSSATTRCRSMKPVAFSVPPSAGMPTVSLGQLLYWTALNTGSRTTTTAAISTRISKPAFTSSFGTRNCSRTASASSGPVRTAKRAFPGIWTAALSIRWMRPMVCTFAMRASVIEKHSSISPTTAFSISPGMIPGVSSTTGSHWTVAASWRSLPDVSPLDGFSR